MSVSPGFYTVVLPQAGHVTIRLKPNDGKFFTDLEEGTLIAAYFKGTANDHQSEYQQFAFIFPGDHIGFWRKYKDADHLRQRLALEELLSGDAEAAGQAYSLESGRCCRCNRLLTNPASILSGIGPVCAHA